MGKPKEVVANLTPDAVAKLKAGKKGEDYKELPDEGKSVTFQYDFGDNTEEAVKIFGDSVVLSYIVGHCLFTLQSIARNKLAAGWSTKKIQAHFFDQATGLNIYKPGEYAGRKSPVEKEHDRIEKMSPEKKSEEIAALKAMLAGLEK